MKFRTYYDLGPERFGDVDFGDEPSLTIQSAKDECDINLIIENANRGVFPSSALNSREPLYGDFSNVADYHSAMNAVRESQAMFEALPSSLRARFANDPALLLEFVADERNRDEAVRLGLISQPDETLQGGARKTPEASDTVAPTVVAPAAPAA